MMISRVQLSEDLICGKEKGFYNAIFHETLDLSGLNFPKDCEVVVNLTNVDEEEIRRLNREYRGKDSVTDVLSFPNFSSWEEANEDPLGVIEIGDVILCCGMIKNAAREDDVPNEREIAFVVSHSFLHLLGFEHGQRMFDIQDRVCDRLSV